MKTCQTRPPVKLITVSAANAVPHSSVHHSCHLGITEIVRPPRKKRVPGNRSRFNIHIPPRKSRLEADPLPVWNGSTETRPRIPTRRSAFSNSAFFECGRKPSRFQTLPLVLSLSYFFFQSVSNGFANNFCQLSGYFSALGGGSTVSNLTRTVGGLY